FSSRRRHTRSKRDWSSDVCSSDLNTGPLVRGRSPAPAGEQIPSCPSCGAGSAHHSGASGDATALAPASQTRHVSVHPDQNGGAVSTHPPHRVAVPRLVWG